MSIYFQGSWPACVAAGVLLYTKARRFGINLYINVVDSELPEIGVHPALLYSPLLVALGVPHSKYDQSTIVLSGESDKTGLLKLEDKWYSIDRSGFGFRDETKELLSILSSSNPVDIQLRQSFIGICQLCNVVPEPGLFDLFFSIPRLEDKLSMLMMFGKAKKSKTSIHEVLGSIEKMGRPELFEIWKERSKGTSLHSALQDIEVQWSELILSEIPIYSSAEKRGLQRSFVEFLGASEKQFHPLRYIRERYRFLGGKFVKEVGKGLCHSFPSSQIPNESPAVLDWLLEQVQLGADSVDMIWKRYTEPEQ